MLEDELYTVSTVTYINYKCSLIHKCIKASASHQLALIMSLPFVHTACHYYYQLNDLVRSSDWSPGGSNIALENREVELTEIWSPGGSNIALENREVELTEIFRRSKSHVTHGHPPPCGVCW